MQKFMDQKEAGEYLGLAPKTLNKWRSLGKGPRYRKFGKAVRYTQEDLDAWANSTTVRTHNRGPVTVAAGA